MATLQIDGIGKVQVDDKFLTLPPAQQAAEVDAIAAQIRGGTAPAAPSAASGPRTEPGMWTDEQENMRLIEQSQPRPDELASRGSILPIGVDKEGNTVLAMPAFLEGPRRTIMDLLDGKRTAREISGREIFELGSLFAGAAAGGPAGTGAGISRAAAEREAAAARPAPSAAPAAPVAAEAPAAATEAAAVRVAAPEPAPAPAAPAPPPTSAVAPTASTAEFKAAARSFYRQAEEAGVEIAPQGARRMAAEVAEAAQKANIDPTLHPRGTAALKRVQDAGVGPLSFERLDQLRQIVKEAGSSPDKGERRIAGILTDKLDDFVEKMGGADVAAGDAAAAKAAIGQARELWSKVAKLETVEGLVERAKISAPNFSGSGLENALRTEFRALAKNDSKMRSFNEQEREAIKRVAKGTVASNAARAGGKFAPTGIVSTVLGGGAGAAVGGGVGAVAVPAIGFAARQLATALTRRHIAQLEALIRSGGESRAASASLARARNTLELLAEQPLPAASAATE